MRPVKPVAPYIGGKRALSKRLTAMIDGHAHTTYAEPFIGMGGIFFRRQKQPACEIINDFSQDVATLFRILQRHYVAFLDMLKYQLTTRTEFERLLKVDPTTLTDLERAARFLYLQRTTFGGKVTKQSFGVSYGRGGRFDVTRLQPMLEEAHERLAAVIIERLGFDRFIEKYDRADTLFYCDPPYWGCEGDYGPIFSRDDFAALKSRLAACKGSFIVSLNDVPEVRELFGEFSIEAVKLNYSISDAGATPAKEVIISRLR
ncbi:DNA adenine methylase [Asticcacaulis sp. YBE204]|uniref:DNA adenine methylase n=1 Tax=Asticcacaulis sp. YBE204 TaxID=1282363 RepID=UPI0003C3B0CF|nr:DNA adenine methylase [Asticcacaulis sp. YBE204]ESQ78448.1 DNA methyltransferase [Asticcacaulis sp. YBE204]